MHTQDLTEIKLNNVTYISAYYELFVDLCQASAEGTSHLDPLMILVSTVNFLNSLTRRTALYHFSCP